MELLVGLGLTVLKQIAGRSQTVSSVQGATATRHGDVRWPGVDGLGSRRRRLTDPGRGQRQSQWRARSRPV